LLLIGGAVFVYLAIDNPPTAGLSRFAVFFIATLIGGRWLRRLTGRSSRNQPEHTWRIADSKHRSLVRAAQAVSLVVPLALLALCAVQVSRGSTSRAIAELPLLVGSASVLVGIAYALQWFREVRSHE
jgi:hypothetical protein